MCFQGLSKGDEGGGDYCGTLHEILCIKLTGNQLKKCVF